MGATASAALPARVPIRVELARIGATMWQVVVGLVKLLVHRPRGRSLPVRAAIEAREVFTRLGPTYVKFGQIIASSPGVFPEVLSSEFRTLLDRVPPADPARVRALIAEDLGAPPEQVFATFDATPLASASIAQVHRATLHSGEQVVVKIQRPGITQRLGADLQILRRVAWLAEKSVYGRMLNASEVIVDFADNVGAELDFAREAASMEEWFAGLADTAYAARVRVPRIHWAQTTARVLTMEYVAGTRIDDLAALEKAGREGKQLVKTILFSLLESALRRGLFHGDLHAGNILVDGDGRIVLLDFGIVGRFDPPTRDLMRQLIVDLLVRNDFEAVSRTFYRLGAVGKPMASSREAAEEIDRLTAPLKGTALSNLSFGTIGKTLIDFAKIHDAKIPRDLVLVGKQLLYVERYMKLLAPAWEPIGDLELLVYVGGLATRN
ncbi:ABC1 kinase family protein [Nocardia sp. NPDC052566]|uniref:ABC1 kinase family protein n=1 Tax=Nocardia sp. NPDC052566 TaxID=3364330 RepID=UPI0037CBEEE6